MPHPDDSVDGRVLAVDHDSLRTASNDILKTVDTLDGLFRQTLAAAPGHPVSDVQAPGDDFDLEYAGFVEQASQAYESLVQRLAGIADGVTVSSRTHRLAGDAAEAAVPVLPPAARV
ncbi:hypothetical protein [Nonomuraea sp. LPB2021202275-12-8]|uniref:hypothetical protein n=1 Tax=Nonomuraea sp. LPB2021202275-12-8 TaxID=3120159 RepID=UPI00300D3B27